MVRLEGDHDVEDAGRGEAGADAPAAREAVRASVPRLREVLSVRRDRDRLADLDDRVRPRRLVPVPRERRRVRGLGRAVVREVRHALQEPDAARPVRDLRAAPRDLQGLRLARVREPHDARGGPARQVALGDPRGVLRLVREAAAEGVPALPRVHEEEAPLRREARAAPHRKHSRMTERVDPDRLRDFARRLFGHLNGAVTSALVYLGDELGLYRALASGGPATSAELATRTGL